MSNAFPSPPGEGGRQRVRAKRGPMTGSAAGWGDASTREISPPGLARLSLPLGHPPHKEEGNVLLVLAFIFRFRVFKEPVPKRQ